MVQIQALPGVSRLKTGSPSPFSRDVSVPYSVAKADEPVTIAVYDLSGRRVRLLVNDKMPQGDHETRWDGRQENGELAPNGVYFFHARIGTVHGSQRVVFIH
jgi:flagellar hook assembly protein FlgD